MSYDLISKTIAASQQWMHSFNQGNAAGCASLYENNAKMHVTPFGLFEGRQKIEAFWQDLFDQGFTDVSYIEPEIAVIDSCSTILKSKWKMNKAQGVITRELWVLQKDGSMRLHEDHFEVDTTIVK